MPTLQRGQVALVTGASVGLGRAFAVALADRGLDLVVVARNEAQLRELQTELGGVHVEVLAADLTDPAQLASVVERVAAGVDLVVNNAGFGTTGRFWALPADGELREVALNVTALVELTHAALRTMVPRGSGGVLNVSSVGGLQGVPGSATYSATKAFVTTFSEAVHEELRGTGVALSCLCPGFTRTEFQERARYDGLERLPDFVWQTAEDVVAIALKGYERGRCIIVPGAHNQALAGISGVAPRVVARKVAGVLGR